MDGSDDEGGKIPESVSNYIFENMEHEPVCFSILPLWRQDRDGPVLTDKQIFLFGLVDNGLQKTYKQVIAWKLELEGIRPKFFTLTKDGQWLWLSRPRAKYVIIIKEILVAIQCLHYLKHNHDATYNSMWVQVEKVFSYFDAKPTILDLREHVPLICEISSRDAGLKKSQLLRKLLEEIDKNRNMRRKDAVNVKNPDFIDDDEYDAWHANGSDDDSDEEQDCFDHVCAICDNGGEILSCEGHCLRSFHASKDLDTGSQCKTLGYTRDQVEAIPRFLCKNCLYKMHQCFACGELGSSDKSNKPEVFSCISATCGHFYHPKCVAKLLHPLNEGESMKEERKIASGQPFLCPIHQCFVCKQVEDKKVKDLQFALCRRCPRSYHRKCLPKKIVSTITDDVKVVRAWDGLLPNRILIFCLRHKMDPVLSTPTRDHIKFPEVSEMKETRSKCLAKAHESVKETGRNRPRQKMVLRPPTTVSNISLQKGSHFPETLQLSQRQCKRSKTSEVIGLPRAVKCPTQENEHVKVVKKEKPMHQLLKLAPSQSARVRPSILSIELPKTSIPLVDKVTERRIMALITKSPSYSLTLDCFIKQKDIPSTHAYSGKQVDKTITIGKVEGSVEAIETALQMIDKDNRSLQYAKAVCEPEILSQMLKWKSKLSVYLGPFLHGVRYTSFGRHFTKVEKLKKIVERLHFYVEAGDTIVDFCCGANDFSVLMKEKLEAVKKECFYKNYDIIPPKSALINAWKISFRSRIFESLFSGPVGGRDHWMWTSGDFLVKRAYKAVGRPSAPPDQNDFNFVKSDWMKVDRKDLPDGSQLIMGLNPPFGVNGALANKFIDKALEFKPKLLILIVPKETQRLDAKRGTRYNLIWEDDKELAGKSFYLPGTVDSSDKQVEQWNVVAPPLYLWSRPDWTKRHKEIAMQQGHIEGVPRALELVGNHNLAEKSRSDSGMTHRSKFPSTQGFSCSFGNDNKRKFEGEGTIVSTKDSITDYMNKKHKSVTGDDPLVIGEMNELSDMSISPTHSDPENKRDHQNWEAPGPRLDGTCHAYQGNGLYVDHRKSHNRLPGANSKLQVHCPPSSQMVQTGNIVLARPNLANLGYHSHYIPDPSSKASNSTGVQESLPGADVCPKLQIRGQPSSQGTRNIVLDQPNILDAKSREFSTLVGRPLNYNVLHESLPGAEMGSRLQCQMPSPALETGRLGLAQSKVLNVATQHFSDSDGRTFSANGLHETLLDDTELASKLQGHGQPPSQVLRVIGNAELAQSKTANLASRHFSNHAHRPSGSNVGNYGFPETAVGRIMASHDANEHPRNASSAEAPLCETGISSNLPHSYPEPFVFVSSSSEGLSFSHGSCGWVDD